MHKKGFSTVLASTKDAGKVVMGAGFAGVPAPKSLPTR